MKISPMQDNLSARLFRCLSRWSLITALMILLTTIIYTAGVGFLATDNVLGQEYAQLIQSVRSPILYRLETLSEALYWLMVGGTLIICACLFARRAPSWAAFIAACGIAQLTGSLASLLRSSGNSDLAARYASAVPNQQAALLQSFLDLQRVIWPYYGVSSLLQGAGFLLVAWLAWSWMGFPRWLAIWLVIAGLLGLLVFILAAGGSSASLQRPIIVLDVIVGLLGLHVAIAVAFWRPSAPLVSGVVS